VKHTSIGIDNLFKTHKDICQDITTRISKSPVCA